MHRIGLALLFALTTAVPGGTQQKNTPSTSQGGVYPSRGELTVPWRLVVVLRAPLPAITAHKLLADMKPILVRTLWTKPTILLPTISKALLQQPM